jgi:competence protein CoiA
MLVAIRISDRERVLASNESKANGPFSCPECSAPVVLHQGKIVTHHFAHRPPITCQYGKGETEAHRRCKLAIYAALKRHPSASKVQIEFNLGLVRPDVFAYINLVPVAIEVQLSTLSPETIARRTEEYGRRGIAVLWLLQWMPHLDTERYSPRRFERWVHAAYFGRAYFWLEDLTVIPYRFAPHSLHVKSSSWYDQNGNAKSAGGYDKKSKRWVNPVRGAMLNLVRDFGKRTRPEFKSKTFSIPKTHLYIDRYYLFPRRGA